MVNKVILIGRIGNEPEGKQFDNGDYVCNISIATTEKYKNNNQERAENTEWHKVVLYKKTAEFVINYLNKGDLVYIEGKNKTRVYKTNEGENRYITEIIANIINPISWGKSNKGNSDSEKESINNHNEPSLSNNNLSLDETENEDDLPF